MTDNIALRFRHTADATPDRVFLLAGDERWTFGQVDRDVRRVSCALTALGVEPGQVVAILLPNSPLFAIAYFGVLQTGAVVMPLHARSTGAEVGEALRESRAVAVIAGQPFHEAARQACADANHACALILAGLGGDTVAPPGAHRLESLLDAVLPEEAARAAVRPVADDADAVILFTSGTTGRPRGVRLSHRNLFAAVPAFAESCGMTRADVLLVFMPASVIPGQLMLNAGALLGASVSLMSAFDPRQLFAAIERHRVTFFPMVPMVAQLMLHSPLARTTDLSSLRGVMIGATTVPPPLVASFAARFAAPVIVPYGLTECSTIAMSLPGAPAPEGSVGKPIAGTLVRIVDDHGRPLAPGQVGEIQVRSPNVMTGYLNRPADTAAAFMDGWLRTGDLGYLDDNGFLFVLERISDVIKTAGNRVFPADVERVLDSHPAVAQSGVLGRPHRLVGEIVEAFVVRKPGAEVTTAELRAFCRERLVGFKRPRRIVFVEQLPRTPTGKVLRRALRAHA